MLPAIGRSREGDAAAPHPGLVYVAKLPIDGLQDLGVLTGAAHADVDVWADAVCRSGRGDTKRGDDRYQRCDGDDTESKNSSLGKVIERARADEVMIYAIGLESNYFNGQRMVRSKPDSGLRKIADETGGGYFELQKTADLAPTFTKVAAPGEGAS